MAKLKAEIFTLCDHASISQEQKLSINGIFDQFFVKEVPSHWPRMFLVTVLKGETQKEYPLKLGLIPPKGVAVNFPDKNFNITLGQNGKANLMTELINFPLPAPGLYTIELKSDQEPIASLEYRINKTTATYGGYDLKGNKISN